MLKWDINLKNGVCGLQFDRSDIPMNKLVVTTLESKFHVFDLRTYHPEKHYAYCSELAHKSTIWGISHLPQNRDLFMTLGGNGCGNLYKYKYPIQRCLKDENGVDYGIPGSVELLNDKKLAE